MADDTCPECGSTDRDDPRYPCDEGPNIWHLNLNLDPPKPKYELHTVKSGHFAPDDDWIEGCKNVMRRTAIVYTEARPLPAGLYVEFDINIRIMEPDDG